MASKKTVKRSRPEADTHAADELVLYIDNTSDLSLMGPSGQGHSVALNAFKRWRKGTYDPKLAVKLFGYLVESGAKRYAKEMGDGQPWSVMFTTATRELAAEEMEKDFRRLAQNGEFDHLDKKRASEARVSELRGTRRVSAGSRSVRAASADKEIGHIGDVNWAEYGGGPIYQRDDGEYYLVYVEPPTDDVDFSDPEARWEIYTVTLDPEVPNWGDIENVCQTTDQDPKELKTAFESNDPVERAWAYETWAGHYGWNNFDSYPQQYTAANMNKRFDAGFDLGGDDDEVDERRMRSPRRTVAMPPGRRLNVSKGTVRNPRSLRAKALRSKK